MPATRRPRYVMPAAIRERLQQEGLRAAYGARPAYQRNHWIGWIGRASLPGTPEKRLGSMLADLRRGDGYMGMEWRPAKPRSRSKGQTRGRRRTPESLLGSKA